MTQNSSYLEQNLERRLVKIREELIAYKTTQRYRIDQIQSVESYSVAYSGILRSDYEEGQTYCLVGFLTFVGVNVNKLARATPYWKTISVTDPTFADYIFLGMMPSKNSHSNVLVWKVSVACGTQYPVPFSGAPAGTSPFSGMFGVTANMAGNLYYERANIDDLDR